MSLYDDTSCGDVRPTRFMGTASFGQPSQSQAIYARSMDDVDRNASHSFLIAHSSTPRIRITGSIAGALRTSPPDALPIGVGGGESR